MTNTAAVAEEMAADHFGATHMLLLLLMLDFWVFCDFVVGRCL
jgi:hypothetical protein